MKRCKVIQNVKKFNGFALDVSEKQFIILSSDQSDLQQLWIKSITSKLSKLERRPKQRQAQGTPSTKSSFDSNKREMPIIDKTPIDHKNDPFYPLMAKLFEAFPELTKGTISQPNNAFNTPDVVEFKENAFVDYKNVQPIEIEAPKPIERKAPTPATNANILEKLDEYFQFK